MSQSRDRIDLNASPGYLVKVASSSLRAAMEEVLQPLDLTVTQYSCLELLAQRPGLSSSELARGAFITRQSMSVLLQILRRDGLVVRTRQAAPGRVLPIELTPAGRRKLALASAAVREVEKRMTGGLTAEEVGRLVDMLERCAASLSAPGASPPVSPVAT